MTEAIPSWAKEMESGKAWLYRQGVWEQIDDPIYELPEDVERQLDPLFYDEDHPVIYEMPKAISVYIFHRKFALLEGRAILAPRYPFHVSLEQDGNQIMYFYLADEPSYIQILPRLLEIVERAGRLRQQ